MDLLPSDQLFPNKSEMFKMVFFVSKAVSSIWSCTKYYRWAPISVCSDALRELVAVSKVLAIPAGLVETAREWRNYTFIKKFIRGRFFFTLKFSGDLFQQKSPNLGKNNNLFKIHFRLGRLIRKTPNSLDEWNGCPEIFGLSCAVKPAGNTYFQ